MDDVTVGRVVRAVCLRARLTQRPLCERAGADQQTVPDIELGRLEELTVRALRRVGRGLDIRLDVTPR